MMACAPPGSMTVLVGHEIQATTATQEVGESVDAGHWAQKRSSHEPPQGPSWHACLGERHQR